MSDRVVLTAFALLVLAARALPAQDELRVLQARRAQLMARVDSLSLVVRAQENAARDSNLRIVVHDGAASMRTTVALEGVGRDALKAATRQARLVLADDTDSLATDLQLSVREYSADYKVNRRFLGLGGYSLAATPATFAGAMLAVRFAAVDYSGTTLDWPVARADLTTGIVAAFERAASTRLPAALDGWLNHRVPLRADAAEFWTSLYRALATSSAAVTRRCVGGNLAACRLALAIDSMPTDRLTAWHDESDWQGLAVSAGDPLNRTALYQRMSIDEREQCTKLAKRDACLRMLSLIPPDALRIPVPEVGRAALFHMALERGGPGAFRRLSAGAAPSVAGMLGAAAGESADSLVSAWQRRVMAGRPHSPLPDTTFFLASTACIVVCGAWAARGRPWT